MKLSDVSARALEIRDLFRKREIKTWNRKDIMLGFLGDVGDLAKLVLAQEGLRNIPDQHRKLEHELADCLWSLMILAKEYDVDIGTAFARTMDEIERNCALKPQA